MESQGTPGHIQVTEATYEMLKDQFEFVHRGTVPIKGKGDMDTWYLVGRRAAEAAQTPAPPEPVEPLAIAGGVAR
jgi:class 3 adenylate cyclase